MRIVQVMPTISIGDAVSNDAIAIKKVLNDMGYDSRIFAENIDGRLQRGTAEKYERIGRIGEEDIVIYHESVGTDLNYTMRDLKCHFIMRYHNITPPKYFEWYHQAAYELSRIGLEQTRMLAGRTEYVLADSEFNRLDLVHMGYQCPMDVLPVLIPFSDYDRAYDKEVVKKYTDGYKNILFVGRIVPQKKQEDIIRIFHFYQKRINQKSRLFLVGNYEGMELYKNRLDRYIQQLGAEHVIFTGHIRFEQILSYYKVADLFLCMSEHEGFCVPLAEAMKFDIPIIAYDSCAIGDTMGRGGILVQNKDPAQIALLMNRVLMDDEIKKEISREQKKMLYQYSYETVSSKLKLLLNRFISSISQG